MIQRRRSSAARSAAILDRQKLSKKLSMEEAEAYEHSAEPSKADDLTLLSEVNVETIAETLTRRHAGGDMYTSIGNVLIAVNPFENIMKV